MSDIDELMLRLSDPEYIIGNSPALRGDMDSLIRYHRNLRAEREAGKGKAARRTAAGTGPKLDISKLMSSIVTAQPSGNVIKRRV